METRVWLKQYDAGVPHTLQPYPQRTLLDIVSDTARQRPDHPVVLFQGAPLSSVRLEGASDAFAAALVALGVQKGDRVAVMLPNCPQAVVGILGIWKAGAIVVPISPQFAEPEVRWALADSGAETALVLTPFYTKVKAAQAGTPLSRIIATNIKEYLPRHLRLLFSAFKEKRGGHRVTLQPGDVWFSDLLRQHAGASRPGVPVHPCDTAQFLYTGGTTGTPKAAMASHHALLMTAMQIHAWLSVVVDGWDDVIIGNMPLFHAFGAVVMYASLVGHNPLALIPDPRDLNNTVRTVRKLRAAFLSGVPAIFCGLLNHPRLQAGKPDLQSLKLCFSGAAPLMLETKRRFEELTGSRMVEGYSLTEAIVATVITPAKGVDKPGSVGVPLPDVEVRITDALTGEGTLPKGQVGEILMRAPNLMQGYWQRPEETAQTIRDGWLFTGDLGYQDEDGYLFIVDRKKDLIKPGGKQVWPREVEEAIASHPAVAEVGVAGLMDEEHREVVAAWVVLRPGQKATADEIRAHCQQFLAYYKVPRRIEFRENLPKSAVGKVLRRELAKLAAAPGP